MYWIKFAAGLLLGLAAMLCIDLVFEPLSNDHDSPGEHAATKLALICFVGGCLARSGRMSPIRVEGRTVFGWPLATGWLLGGTCFGLALFQTRWVAAPAAPWLPTAINAGVSLALGAGTFALGSIWDRLVWRFRGPSQGQSS